MPAELALPGVLTQLAGRRERQQPVWLISSDRGGRFSEWIDLGELSGREVTLLPLSAARRESGEGLLVFVDEASGDVVEISGELDLERDAIHLSLRAATGTPAAQYVPPDFVYDFLPRPEVVRIDSRAALDAVGRRFCVAVLWPIECVLDPTAHRFCLPLWEMREDIHRGTGPERECAACRWDLTLDNVHSATVQPGSKPYGYEFFTGLAYNRRQGIIRHRPWGLSLARTPSIELHIGSLAGTLTTSAVPTWRWDWTDRQAEPSAPPSP